MQLIIISMNPKKNELLKYLINNYYSFINLFFIINNKLLINNNFCIIL